MKGIRRTISAARTAGQAIAHATLGRLAHLRHLLDQAAAHGRRVQIAYVREGGEASIRIVAPLEVRCSKAGDLYVRAYDMLREAKRSFRLDRITAINPTTA